VASTLKVCVAAEPLTAPEMRPVEDPNDRPAGSDPDETLHAIGAVPSLDMRVCEYPASPLVAGVAEVVVTVGAELTVMVRDAPIEATPLLSVATTVKVWLAALLSTVPEMRPLDGARKRPVGRDPDERVHVIGGVPPLRVRVWA